MTRRFSSWCKSLILKVPNFGYISSVRLNSKAIPIKVFQKSKFPGTIDVRDIIIVTVMSGSKPVLKCFDLSYPVGQNYDNYMSYQIKIWKSWKIRINNMNWYCIQNRVSLRAKQLGCWSGTLIIEADRFINFKDKIHLMSENKHRDICERSVQSNKTSCSFSFKSDHFKRKNAYMQSNTNEMFPMNMV